MLERQSPIPLYYQLKEKLVQMFKDYKIGDRIPPENEIAQLFSVSRPTVRQALNELVSEGRIEKRKGEGSFVSKPGLLANSLITIMSLAQQMDDLKLNYSTKLIVRDKRSAELDIAENLNLDFGTDFIYIERLRLLDDEPFYLSQSHLLCSSCEDILKADLVHHSLFSCLINDCGMNLHKVKRYLEPVASDEYLSGMLEVSRGAPLHYLQTFSYSDTGKLWGYFRDYFRGDRSCFAFTIVKKGEISITTALSSLGTSVKERD
jgi:GntR family transcriptional regulator